LSTAFIIFKENLCLLNKPRIALACIRHFVVTKTYNFEYNSVEKHFFDNLSLLRVSSPLNAIKERKKHYGKERKKHPSCNRQSTILLQHKKSTEKNPIGGGKMLYLTYDITIYTTGPLANKDYPALALIHHHKKK
jgi:hypothetical protein